MLTYNDFILTPSISKYCGLEVLEARTFRHSSWKYLIQPITVAPLSFTQAEDQTHILEAENTQGQS